MLEVKLARPEILMQTHFAPTKTNIFADDVLIIF
jgi:hypothetical protein